VQKRENEARSTHRVLQVGDLMTYGSEASYGGHKCAVIARDVQESADGSPAYFATVIFENGHHVNRVRENTLFYHQMKAAADRNRAMVLGHAWRILQVTAAYWTNLSTRVYLRCIIYDSTKTYSKLSRSPAWTCLQPGQLPNDEPMGIKEYVDNVTKAGKAAAVGFPRIETDQDGCPVGVLPNLFHSLFIYFILI
jgi:hypothetical protein